MAKKINRTTPELPAEIPAHGVLETGLQSNEKTKKKNSITPKSSVKKVAAIKKENKTIDQSTPETPSTSPDIQAPEVKVVKIKKTVKKVDKAPATKQVKASPSSAKEMQPPKIKVVAKKLSKQIPSSLKVTFQLKYSSSFGQSLFIMGDHEKLGGNEVITAIAMQYLNGDFWYVTVDFPEPKNIVKPITYNYYLKNEDGTISIEWGNDKKLVPAGFTTDDVLIVDSWNYAGYYENTFYTEPFKQVLLKEKSIPLDITQPSVFSHTFKIKAPLLPRAHSVCLAGNAVEFGEWDLNKVLLLDKTADDDWFSVNVDLSEASFPVVYKYGVYSIEQQKCVGLETGDNRFAYDGAASKKLTILADGFIKLPNNTFKGAGVSIPVFSLRSNKGLGVGEFTDIKNLVDWAKKIGLKLIQILPVNDTTATHTDADSYPYAAISAFALHPIYLNVAGVINKENSELLSLVDEKTAELNQAAAVNYHVVFKTKLDLVKEIFPLQKQETFGSEEFNAFFSNNAHWLVPYAAFRYLTDLNGTADFNAWSSNNSFDVFEINALATPVLAAIDEISIHYFIQYHLHLQLRSATEYAHANGIILKGDIPIGIFRNSCDAWQQPRLYNMDMQAGAPPDDFAIKGQNWGFPTYNWQRMAEDGFSWWKQRFAQMSHYFDAFRIDHILGFFRIWSIPLNSVEGVMGYFVPSIPVHINEFHERSIWFDHHRYTKPFINDQVLHETFGSDADIVRDKFLSTKIFDYYDMLPAFNTQRKVEEYFASLEDNDQNGRLRQGLYDLIGNIILFEVEGSQAQQYHFRIAMENTSSFRFLEFGTQQKLKELYVNYFYRRQDDFWMKEALMKLPELKRSTNMLICGEDLGMVPACVPGVMSQLGILSLEIQRMPKDPAKEFFHPNDAPYLSVVTPSTHDMSTVRGWWEEDRSKTQRFFNHELMQHGTAPYFCDSWVNRAIVLQHLYSPAMWSIFQLQDILGISDKLRRENPGDERINIPANPKHFWQYRMHINIEDLIEEDAFNNELAEYIKLSGR